MKKDHNAFIFTTRKHAFPSENFGMKLRLAGCYKDRTCDKKLFLDEIQIIYTPPLYMKNPPAFIIQDLHLASLACNW